MGEDPEVSVAMVEVGAEGSGGRIDAYVLSRLRWRVLV